MKYTKDDIVVMEGLEHIRRRPAMYVGSIDEVGLQFLIDEIVKYFVSTGRKVEVAGYCISIYGEPLSVQLHPRINKSNNGNFIYCYSLWSIFQ